ncbi:hypothetical protein [Exiguobacterium sp. H66]|uniref:hypothetical protein n=1 Tax=Exiguobacterium sp. H66 TaxID=2751208 RepID=UPI001BEBD79C|nr:hypothetical protein [Exiguobacterium sp. H66]
MKKILLFLCCALIGLSTGSVFMLHYSRESPDNKWRDGALVTRYVGTSVANTNAMTGFIERFPFSDALKQVQIEGTTVSLRYEVTGKSRKEWVGTNHEWIDPSTPSFIKSRFPQLVMHHTLALFLAIPNVMTVEIQYTDPVSILQIKITRTDFEGYTPRDIERASTSTNRFNRVVIDDYVLVESRRKSFLEYFRSQLKIYP